MTYKSEKTITAKATEKSKYKRKLEGEICMKIDVTKIEGYENMSAEEKLKALEEFELETPNVSDELAKLKNSLNKASSEAAEYKRQLKEKMTEQERIEAERQEELAKKDKLLNDLIKEKKVTDFTNNFLSVGFTDEIAKNSAEAIVNEDYATVFNNLKTFVEGVEKSAKAEVIKSTPKPTGTQNDTPSVTKEQFNKMEYMDRINFQKENPDLFEVYSKSE